MKKVAIDNPRYPHAIRIVRKVEKDWLEEEEAVSDGSTSGDETDTDIVIYEGPGRSYTETTTTGDKKVDTNRRKCSIPVRFDEWGSSSDISDYVPYPMSGDLVYVTKGSITEEWEVKDFEPDNNRSVVYGEMNRNYNIE